MMIDQKILTILCSITGVMLIFMYGWFKRSKGKVRELEIARFIGDTGQTTQDGYVASHAIESTFGLPVERVRKICSRSKLIQKHPQKNDFWRSLS